MVVIISEILFMAMIRWEFIHNEFTEMIYKLNGINKKKRDEKKIYSQIFRCE